MRYYSLLPCIIEIFIKLNTIVGMIYIIQIFSFNITKKSLTFIPLNILLFLQNDDI